MEFYAQPAFYVAAAIAAIPAIVLGACGRRLAPYGMVASVAFVLLLFFRTPLQLLACAGGLALCVVLYLAVRRLFRDDAQPRAVLWYRIALVVQIAPLVVCKVSALFDQNLLGFVGISYLTFKSVQVLIETRDGLIDDLSIGELLYFLVFFPPFSSGPIMRSRPFVKQMREPLSRAAYLDLLSTGLLQLLLGAVYKFAFGALTGWLLWFVPQMLDPVLAACAESLFFGMNLFFDFAGYSLMAMGLGAVFGVKVPRNFNMPFRSIDIGDFWNRWHMTLSFWLRDYVFMRMVKGFLRRRILSSSMAIACLSYVVEMTLMGAWHGLTLNFVLFGVYHGVLLALNEIWQRTSPLYKRYRKTRPYRLLSWAVTMVAVFYGFSLFSGQALGSFGM